MESMLWATGCFQKMSGSGWRHLVLTCYPDKLQFYGMGTLLVLYRRCCCCHPLRTALH